jgi:hypothetical protein
MNMQGRGWMDVPPPDDEASPAKGCMVALMIMATIWVALLILLDFLGVIG